MILQRLRSCCWVFLYYPEGGNTLFILELNTHSKGEYTMRKKLLYFGSLIAALSLMLSIVLPTASMAAAAQPYKWQNVKIEGGGGYIPGIVFNQTEKNLVYARTDMGGAYRSTDGGNTWTQLMNWVSYEDWELAGVDSLATDAADPNRLYLQCGLYTNSWGSRGAVLRSTDKGNTFQITELPFKVGGNMPGRNMGERLAIDPNKNSILFMGAREGQGLWKSSDYGATWTKVASFPNPGTYIQDPNDTNDYLNHYPGVVWVTFDKKSSTAGNATKTIYVGVADLKESIYRSNDGGNTWEAVPGQPTGMLPQHGKMSPKGILYVPYNNTQGPYDGSTGDVWKLETATGVWTRISPIPSTDTANCYFGYGGLAIDPQNPDIIMAASLSSWWPDGYIWRSKDGGNTWSPIWSIAGYPNRVNKYTLDISQAPWMDFGQLKSMPETSPKLGAMMASLEIDPFNSSRFMFGTGAGIWKCDNADKWDDGTMVIKVGSIGMEETSVLSLVSPPTGPNLVSGLGDIAGFLHTDLTKAHPWIFVQPNLTSNHCIDYAENNPQFWVRCGDVDKQWNPNTNRTGFSYSAGENWFQGNSEPNGMPMTGGGGTIAANADGTAVVYAPAVDYVPVCYSTDNGNTWTPVTGGVPNKAKVRSDRVNPNKFYAYKDGEFYYSTDKGKSFTKSAAAGLPKKGSTGNFKAVFGREGDIWLAPGGDNTEGINGLWHSTDGGKSFTKLSNVQKSETVGFGMAAPGQSYPAIYIQGVVDNVRGFYRSDDAGATWVKINDAANQFGNANADLTGDRRVYGRVYIGTNGFGIKMGEPAGTIPEIIVGDLNGDKSVDATDYALMKMYLLGAINDFPVENDIIAGDLNSDGVIDALDFSVFKRFLLGTVTKLPYSD